MGWIRAHLRFLQRIGWGPRDAVAGIVGAAAILAILVNALFLQSGPHPAPLFKMTLASIPAADATSVVTVPRPRPAELTPGKNDVLAAPRQSGNDAAKKQTAAAPVRSDAIADILGPSKRVAAVQRALAQFGYGQIKPTGMVDAETRAAIEKFELERKLPATGQPSERVIKELANLTGRSID